MRKEIDALFTKKSDDWRTPSQLYDAFMSLGFYDPCPYKSDINLFGKVLKNKRIYMNPPFSQNKIWIKYAIDLYKDGCDVWLLIAVRSDTNYFRNLYEQCRPVIYFFNGRLSFNDKGHAPFPVCILHLSHVRWDIPFYHVCTMDEFISHLKECYGE